MNDAFTGRRILLGITGSVAASIMPQQVAALRLGLHAEVRVVLTAAAGRFATPAALAAASGGPVYADDATHGLPVPHVDLTSWAQILLIMPATANTIGQIALGLAPGLLTTCALAATCPVAVVPSMNAAMWGSPAVQRNVATLRADGRYVVDPVAGVSLGEGGVGVGAMPMLTDVLAQIAPLLTREASRAAA